MATEIPLINYEGAGPVARTPITGEQSLAQSLITKAITGGITVTSDGSLDYATPVNGLHRGESTPVAPREYSGGFGY